MPHPDDQQGRPPACILGVSPGNTRSEKIIRQLHPTARVDRSSGLSAGSQDPDHSLKLITTPPTQ